jgi:alpha-aminoadipic semialdehyde synthase
MYWDAKYPRLITDGQMREMQEEGRSRLIGVCDITCDLEGSIQFLKKFTDCDSPFYTYFPQTDAIVDGCNGQ